MTKDDNVVRAIANLCESYQKDGNPLQLWMAYKFSRSHDTPVPSEFFQYLDSVAHNLSVLFVTRTGLNGAEWEDVGEALLFKTGKGRGTAFSKLQTESKHFSIAFDYSVLKSSGIKPKTIKLELMEKHKVGESTVKSAWKKYKSHFKVK